MPTYNSDKKRMLPITGGILLINYLEPENRGNDSNLSKRNPT